MPGDGGGVNIDRAVEHGIEARRAQREASTYVIWPPSPPQPLTDEFLSSAVRPRSRRHHRHHRHHPWHRRSSSRHPSDTKDALSIHPSDSDEDVVGPHPMSDHDNARALDERAYGKQLLPGEGAAMASYVQSGKRIPRRGEIGLNADQIEAFERAGFVMSGSRHGRMDAVRTRKEHQVISAEQRQSQLSQKRLDRARKEAEIIHQFRDMVDTMPVSYTHLTLPTILLV